MFLIVEIEIFFESHVHKKDRGAHTPRSPFCLCATGFVGVSSEQTVIENSDDKSSAW
ncbi:MAG: hypothetical protein Tsb009_19670 [Planctomycetaceae bacterium]